MARENQRLAGEVYELEDERQYPQQHQYHHDESVDPGRSQTLAQNRMNKVRLKRISSISQTKLEEHDEESLTRKSNRTEPTKIRAFNTPKR